MLGGGRSNDDRPRGPICTPVARNQQLVCQGANYRQHMIESGMDPDAKTFNLSAAWIAPASFAHAYGPASWTEMQESPCSVHTWFTHFVGYCVASDWHGTFGCG